jgi:urease accessory protein
MNVMNLMNLIHPDFGSASGFWHGFAHPFSGLDHTIAMIAVGIWAYQIGGKATWLIPLSFVGTMIIGGIIGIMGVQVPFVETGIILSVLILGVLITASFRLPIVAGMILVGVFALFHGHSHGTEIPVLVSGAAYSAGFAISTIMLHASGIAVGAVIGRRAYAFRYVGALILVVSGIMFLW